MIKKAEEQFIRAIDKACQDYNKALLSERIKEGIRNSKLLKQSK